MLLDDLQIQRRRGNMKTNIQALAAVSLFGLVAMAFAQDQKAPAPGGIHVSAADQIAVREYWTVERMANAKPMPLPMRDPAPAAAHASPLARPEPAQFTPGGLPTDSVSTGDLPSETFEMLDHGEAATTPTPTSTPFSYEYPFTNYQPPAINNYPYSTVGKLFFVIPP